MKPATENEKELQDLMNTHEEQFLAIEQDSEQLAKEAKELLLEVSKEEARAKIEQLTNPMYGNGNS